MYWYVVVYTEPNRHGIVGPYSSEKEAYLKLSTFEDEYGSFGGEVFSSYSSDAKKAYVEYGEMKRGVRIGGQDLQHLGG